MQRTAQRASEVAVALATLLSASLASMPSASAAQVALATSTSTVTAGLWGATPTAASVTSPPDCQASPSPCGPVTLSSSYSHAYFNLWDTGTEALSGAVYDISPAGNQAGPLTLDITACSAPWLNFLWFSFCTGTRTTVLSGVGTGTFPVTQGVPPNPGDVTYLQVSCSGWGCQFDVTISISVGPADVVTATTNA